MFEMKPPMGISDVQEARTIIMKKIKLIMIAVLILLLLPYITTNYFSKEVKDTFIARTASENYISIQVDGVIKEIAFEDYVMGVAAKGVDLSYSLETMKAMMVVVRTNLYRQLEEEPGKLFSQDYVTLSELEQMDVADKMQQAAEATKGMVITIEEKLVRAPFHSVSAGKTRSGEEVFGSDTYSYLQSVDSGQDIEGENFLTIDLVNPGNLVDKVNKEYPDSLNDEISFFDQAKIISRDSAGYVKQFQAGKTVIPGEKMREILGLNSSCFYMEMVDNKVRITVKGLGHGLGLSQFGSEVMAQAGAGYSEILQHYFTGITLAEKSRI